MRTRSLFVAIVALALWAPAAFATTCWTAPRDWSVIASGIVTAPMLNTDVRDNTNCLQTDINTDGTITRIKRLTTNTVTVGNVGAGPTNLMTYTASAGQLSVDGQIVKVHAAFQMAANSNTKTLIFAFGACTATIYSSSINNQQGIVDVDVVRTGAATERMLVRYLQSNNGNTTGPQWADCTETLSGAVTLKFTGASGGSANNDIQQVALFVEFEN